MPDQIDDGAEAAVTRLTEAIEAIEPHVSALHMRIILQGDAAPTNASARSSVQQSK